MKKLLTFLALALFAAYSPAFAVDESLRTTNNIATWKVGISTQIALGISSNGAVYNTLGIIIAEDFIYNPFPASSDSFKSKGFWISTRTMTESPTSWIEANISSQPLSYPRNIVVFSSAPIGVATTTLLGAVTFYGIDNLGIPVSEMIRFSTAIPVLSLASNVVGQGNIAWARISSFTIQITSVTDTFGLHVSSVGIFIGYGNKFGLSNDLADKGDVFFITEQGPGVTASQGIVPARISDSYNTYIPINEPTGLRSYMLRYTVKNSPRKHRSP